jgi:hypothetical protein
MKNISWCVGLAALSLTVLNACSNTEANRKLDEKLNAEPAPASSEALRNEARTMIESSKTLSQEEKTKLLALGDSVRADTQVTRDESLKLRALLIKEITAEPYNANEVNLIKKRLKANSDKRLEVIYKAVESANQILGHNEEKQKIMGAFFGRHAEFERD